MSRKSDGFSLIELMIALVVTLLVSGAVFGLLTAGQSAFRREPQLTERQQSLRQAMTIIQEDVVRAGTGLPGFTQVFTDNLDGTGALQGTLGGGATDALELLAGDVNCAPEVIDCAAAPPPQAGAAGDISVAAPPPTCVVAGTPGFFAFFDGSGVNFAVQPVTAVNRVNGGACLSTVTAGARVPGTPVGATFSASGYVPVQLVRYEIANCPAPDNNVPCLYRSVTGRNDVNGAVVGPAPGPGGNATWQVIARGIEDLQVQYRTGFSPGGAGAVTQQCENNLAWPCNDNPGVVVACDNACVNAAAFNTVVTQVQVTLAARTLVGGLQGETANAQGPQRVRGQLSGVFTPRAALATLTHDPSNPPRWR